MNQYSLMFGEISEIYQMKFQLLKESSLQEVLKVFISA